MSDLVKTLRDMAHHPELIFEGDEQFIVDTVTAAADEIARLQAALHGLIEAIDASPRRLPHGPGPQEIGVQMRSMTYSVGGEHVERARDALGE